MPVLLNRVFNFARFIGALLKYNKFTLVYRVAITLATLSASERLPEMRLRLMIISR